MATSEADATPDLETPPKPFRKPVIQKDEDPKPDRKRRVKGQSLVSRKDEAPVAVLELSTPELSPASSSSDNQPPPVVTAALPASVEQKDAKIVWPHDAGVPPMPVRKPAMKKSEVGPDRAKSHRKPASKPVIQESEVNSKPDRKRLVKGQSFVDGEAEQRPDSGSTDGLLAGGL